MWGLLVRSLFNALRAGSTDSVSVASYGRVTFVGLIGNRPLAELGQQEIRNALAKIGMREAHNAHFVSRLIDRGPQFDMHTLNDLARAINSSTATTGWQSGTIEIVLPNGRAALVVNSSGDLITFLPL
jgi:hypothetical protein